MILDARKLYTYFSANFVLDKTSQNWWAFDCPFCVDGADKKKMAVHFYHEVCKCWKCGYKDYVVQFVMDYEDKDYGEAKNLLNEAVPTTVALELLEQVKILEVSDVILPTGFNAILDGKGVLGNRARKYLEGRGFDLEVLDTLGFGYCDEHDKDKDEDYFGYIIIPFKRRGLLQYYIGRDFTGNWLRYKNPKKVQFGVGKADLLFNEDALELRKTVYVSEGWADAMTMGKGGVSTQGWSLSTKQKSKIMTSSCERLVFVPDIGEEKGVTFYQKATRAAMDFIEDKEVYVVDLSEAVFQAGGLIGKDANDFGRDFVMAQLKETPRLTESMAMEIIC